MKDGSVIVPTPTFITVKHDSTAAVYRSDYRINRISTSDSGMYRCNASNPIGTRGRVIYVDVVNSEFMLISVFWL